MVNINFKYMQFFSNLNLHIHTNLISIKDYWNKKVLTIELLNAQILIY